MQNNNISTTVKKLAVPLNEDGLLESLLNKPITGTLETGSRFFGRLIAFNDKLILLDGTDGRRILLKRKMIARLEGSY